MSAAPDALKAAETPNDVILTHPWLTQARDRQEEPVEAVRHSHLALTDQRPLEQSTTVALLRILTRSTDRELTLNAATALADLHHKLLLQSPDTPDSLRDLSLSLNNVTSIQQQHGQLNETLDAYTEALHWYALLDERYGPPFADPDELAALRDAVGAFPGTAQLDDRARRFTGAAGQAASTVMTPCRHSHGISF